MTEQHTGEFVHGCPKEDVETGDKYRVTKCVDLGEGKIVSLNKELIEEQDTAD
jgi:hypothetical protein